MASPSKELFECYDVYRLKQLIKAGANVNCRNNMDQTPLLMAAARGYDMCAHVLIQCGADVNANFAWKQSVLILAAKTRNEVLVEMLLDHGAKVNAQDEGGWSVLHHMAARGNDNIVALLLDSGADVTLKTKTGKIALDVAKGKAKRLIKRRGDTTGPVITRQCMTCAQRCTKVKSSNICADTAWQSGQQTRINQNQNGQKSGNHNQIVNSMDQPFRHEHTKRRNKVDEVGQSAFMNTKGSSAVTTLSELTVSSDMINKEYMDLKPIPFFTKQKEDDFKSYLITQPVVDYLIAIGILTAAQSQDNNYLLNLMKQSPKYLHAVSEALKATKQDYVAALLE